MYWMKRIIKRLVFLLSLVPLGSWRGTPTYTILEVVMISILISASQGRTQTWIKLTPASSTAPSPRYNASGIYDEVGNNFVIFGGRNSNSSLNDVWSFSLDTLTWTNITPSDTNRPAKRFGHIAVYDRPSRRMFIWSGQGVGFYNDVWAFDLTLHTWQNVMPGGLLPNPRYGSASVYDPLNRRLVMFSGFTDVGRYDDTQAYDITNNTWIDLTPIGTNPLARCLHTASYDSGRHRMIVYAGQHSGPLDDIWAFDLASNMWRNLTPALRPTGRIFPSSIYSNDRIIVFGGQTNAGSVNELWSFDLVDTAWTMINASGTIPGRRNSHAAISVPHQGAMVIFGGIGDSVYNDVWKLSEIPTDVRERQIVPETFKLFQNYPNPFNPTTTVGFRIVEFGLTTLQVFDMLGRKAATLLNEELFPGMYTRTWDARGMASGVYVFRLQSGQSSQTVMMVVVR